ncbi:MAG: glutamate-5-semialdehyde dehydrogenase [Spirochaetaceae bacterium]|nr:glutamate-5-semialdehyde dehydrogenase [Spirochaetaceae bacterium]
MDEITKICKSLRQGANQLALHTANQKNQALKEVVISISKSKEAILAANKIDVEKAISVGTKESLVDRLRLTSERIDGIIDSINIIIEQADPVGQCVTGWTNPNGLRIVQKRVPLGVAAIIYESRPNVTADAFALAYKSGNSILLRGSSSALESNKAIVKAIKEGLEVAFKYNSGVPQAIELASSGNRDEVDAILNAVNLVDVVLPRGGSQLIKLVVEKARVPVIETGSGICHMFVDKTANINMACDIAENAKLQRAGVCNAIETLVVHKEILADFLPQLEERFKGRAILKCDEDSYKIVLDSASKQGRENCVEKATPEDFGYEFLDNILAIKTVDSINEAIDFINQHNTHHSETIITSCLENANLFQNKIDAACVYVNASTRFTDGGEFGFGAELGISTQKLHARGPMGLSVLTTTKYFINGEGQIR